jgi:hypothetical protein
MASWGFEASKFGCLFYVEFRPNFDHWLTELLFFIEFLVEGRRNPLQPDYKNHLRFRRKDGGTSCRTRRIEHQRGGNAVDESNISRINLSDDDSDSHLARKDAANIRVKSTYVDIHITKMYFFEEIGECGEGKRRVRVRNP